MDRLAGIRKKALRSWRTLLTDEERTMPWIVVGTGSSFDTLKAEDMNGRRVLSLNRVARVLTADVAFFRDYHSYLDAITYRGDLPCRIVHQSYLDFRGHRRLPITEFLDFDHVLRRAASAGRLFVYETPKGKTTYHNPKLLLKDALLTIHRTTAAMAVELLLGCGVLDISMVGFTGPWRADAFWTTKTPRAVRHLRTMVTPKFRREIAAIQKAYPELKLTIR